MRYVTAFGWHDDDFDPLADPHVDGPKTVNTGLVTEKGVPIMRMQPPVGFGRDKEWS